MIVLIYGFLILLLLVLYQAYRYRNPYKLYMVFGKKGSGKTTLMNKLAIRYRKRGWKVYSDHEMPGCYLFDINDFGKILFPPDSLVLVDEVGLIWDNRNFKSFPEHVKRYFKYQRQYRNVVYLFSQSFDVDKKIRDLTDHLYIVSNVLNIFSVARRVTKKITIVHADRSAQGESKIVDDYNIDSILWAFFGSVEITYIPKYVKYFKSFDPPALPDLQVEPLPDTVPEGFLPALLRSFREPKEILKRWKQK